MRKMKSLVPALVLLMILLTGTASADYGYTSVSDIPMAVDFTFSVDFDDGGLPHIVTDYPFETAGATEMNLVYGNEENPEVLTLNYNHSTGVTSIGSRNEDLLGTDDPEKAYRMIRSGELTPDGYVYINTSSNGLETDWVLVYAARENNYTEYKERTYQQAFNAMGNGGTEKAVYYRAGEIESSRLLRRIYDADLVIEYDPSGEITYASITRYGTETVTYDYDPSTGLFGGRPISELGFDEADLKIQALAARGTRTGAVVAVDPQAVSGGNGAGSVFVLAGSIITGILLGLVLVKKFRSWRNSRKQSLPEADAGSRTGSENADTKPAAPPAEEEFPGPKFMSSGK